MSECDAELPVPSELPQLDDPEIVETSPEPRSIARMRQLPESPTYKCVPEMARPVGALKRAAVPFASKNPELPTAPAIVVTSLVAGSRRRTACAPVSVK